MSLPFTFLSGFLLFLKRATLYLFFRLYNIEMKTKLLVIFSALSGIVTAQTVVGGSISSNTTWSLTGSPYIVQNNVAVMAGVTLIIDPGVTVKFDSQKSIQFFGTLRAIGTQNQPITFTSGITTPNPGDWGYILFNSSSPSYNFSNGSGSIMQCCVVEYAGGASVTYNGAVRMNNTFPYLNNCTIQHNSKTAIKAWNLSSTLFLDSCIIKYNNVDTGSVYASSGTLSLRGCNISNNITSLASSNDYSVAGVFTNDNVTRISRCTFTSNNSRAVHVFKGGTALQLDSISFNTISNNLNDGIYYLFDRVAGVLDLSGKSIFIGNNIIYNNAGNGIRFNSVPSGVYDSYFNSFVIANNIIADNLRNGFYSISYSSNSWNNTFNVSNNIVSNNSDNGISFSEGSKSSGESYSIINNTIKNNSGKGISYALGSGVTNPNTFSNLNNTIVGNRNMAISFSLYPSVSSPVVDNLIIQKNKLVGNSGIQNGAIYIYTAINCPLALSINQNIIADNNSSAEGAGLYMNVNEASNLITNNTIINNTASTSSAIYYKGTGVLQANKNTIVYNKTTGSDSLRMIYLKQSQSFNNNNIYGFPCFSPIDLWYDDYNGNTLNAQSCYWKKSAPAGIDSIIWDYFDDQNLAIVDHANFKSLPDTAAPVTPVENIVKTNLGGGNIQLSWSPNLETDLAGYKIYWGSPTGYSFVNMVNAGNVGTYTISPVSMSDTIAVTAYDTQADGIDDQVEGHESWFNYDTSIPTPSITVSSSSPICSGNCATLTASAMNGNLGYSYMWSPGSLTTSSITVCPSTTSDYTITVSNSCGRDTSSSVNVKVNLPPTVHIYSSSTTICAGAIVILSSSLSASYSWSTGASASSITVAPFYTKTYSVFCTDMNGCTGIDSVTITVQSCTGISQIANDDDIIISPNPSEGIFIMENDKLKINYVEVYNLFGEKVFESITLKGVNNSPTSIDISFEPEGVYFVHFISDKGTTVKKIIISK